MAPMRHLPRFPAAGVTAATVGARSAGYPAAHEPTRRGSSEAPPRRREDRCQHPWPYRTARELAAPTVWARSREGLARAAAAVARRHRRRRAARQLMAFDDRMLRDVGLGRGEVERAVWHGRG